MTINAINQTEMKKLANGLMDRRIAFTMAPLWDGLQIRREEWDAICHHYSYGGEKGLIEVMGLPECGDDVIGWLTADDVLVMIDKLSNS